MFMFMFFKPLSTWQFVTAAVRKLIQWGNGYICSRYEKCHGKRKEGHENAEDRILSWGEGFREGFPKEGTLEMDKRVFSR